MQGLRQPSPHPVVPMEGDRMLSQGFYLLGITYTGGLPVAQGMPGGILTGDLAVHGVALPM